MQNSPFLGIVALISMEHLFLISCKGLRDNAMPLWKFFEHIHRQMVWRRVGIQGVGESHDSLFGLCVSDHTRVKTWQEEAQKRRDEERQKEEERCAGTRMFPQRSGFYHTIGMKRTRWSLKDFFSEGWKGEEHIDSTLASLGRPPCLAAWLNAFN